MAAIGHRKSAIGHKIISSNFTQQEHDFISDGGSDTESEDQVETTTDPFLVAFIENCSGPPGAPWRSYVIRTEIQWDAFVHTLHMRHLVSSNDLPRLEKPPQLPCTYDGFRDWVGHQVFGKEWRFFENKANGLLSGVQGIRVMLHHWGLHTLTQEEMYRIQIIMEEVQFFS